MNPSKFELFLMRQLVEDPFSILSPLVPDPPSRPGLIPLYAPLSAVPSTSHADDFNRSTSILRDQGRQSVPPYGDPQSRTEGSQQQPSFPLFPSATSVPLGHSSTDFSFYEPLTSSQPSNRRHWNISRAVNTRQKGKDRDEEDGQDCPYWQQPREPHPTDFGSFSLLAGELAEEMRRRGLAPGMVQPTQEQQIHFDFIRDSLAINPPPTEIQETKKVVDASGPREQEEIVQNYWTKERLVEGESYLQDLVYGGETGMAYVRSLAEFMQYIPEPESEDEVHFCLSNPISVCLIVPNRRCWARRTTSASLRNLASECPSPHGWNGMWSILSQKDATPFYERWHLSSILAAALRPIPRSRNK